MENKNKSGLSIVIIGLIVLVAITLGGCSSDGLNKYLGGPAPTQTPSTSPVKTPDFTNAPPGANPAWTKGSPTAKVTIEEFADFQCPTCAAMHPKVQEVRSAFGDRVRIIFRQFPLQGHRWGYDAACATEAAGVQGKFWEMQNMIFNNQQSWANSTDARAVFADYAKTLGLNVEQFNNDMGGMMVKNRVEADLQRGRGLSINSTPSFFINNKPLGSNLDGLKAAVEKALQDAEGGNQTSAAPANSNVSNIPNTANSNASGISNSVTNSGKK